jgi:branched-chain amino acid transport system substrate-binding protein
MTGNRIGHSRSDEFWHSGKVTRRRLVGWGAGVLGATMLVPAPWRAGFGQANPYKIGTLQPLTGPGAAGGKAALVGVQMAVDRINRSGGINGRPVDLVVADDQSQSDVAREKAARLVGLDRIHLHVGGFFSNACLACMPVWQELKIVNMITVCIDTTLTTTGCNRYSFRLSDYVPAQAVAFAPYLVGKLVRKWHIVFTDSAWGRSTRDAYADQIRKAGGEVVDSTGIPPGTADMTPFLSRISGNFDGLFAIFAGADAVTLVNQAYDLGLTKKYKWAGDSAIADSTNLLAFFGHKIEGFVSINRYLPVLQGPLDTAAHRRFLEEARVRLKAIDPAGPLPDRYLQANYEGMNAVRVGIEKSGFRGDGDTMRLIEALEGLEMKEGDDFPQGDKVLRKDDHQAFLREFIFEIKDGRHRLLERVGKENTIFPPACRFPAT